MDVLGVVPIFMSAGAAALPTLLAAVASVTAILLKPREFLRICRQRPLAVAITIAIVIVACGGGLWWWMAPSAARAATIANAGGTSKYDWVAIAQNILNEEQAGKIPTVIAPPMATDTALVLGRDYSRCSFAGGSAPMQLLPKWTFQPKATWFLSVPAVAGNRIFAAGTEAGGVGHFFGKLACLDAETGNPLWQVDDVNGDFPHAFFSSPALTQDGKYLVIGEGLHDNDDCQLRCFDAATGDFRWAVKTPLHIESSPAILGDMVVVGCGAIEGDDRKATGDPGHVLAVRISDGKELWRVSVNDPESSPAIDKAGTVYIGSGFNGNAVVAIHGGSDEELRDRHLDRIAWRTPVAQPVTSPITLIGDLVIAGAGNSDFVYADPNPEGWVIALESHTGKVRWQMKFPDAVIGAISAKDGKLICPMRTGEVAALDLADGHVLWKTEISGTAPILAGCAFTGTRVYAVSSDGYLAVLDANNGAILGKKIYINDQNAPGTNKCMSAPQVSDGRVIVGSETGGLHCYVGTRSAE